MSELDDDENLGKHGASAMLSELDETNDEHIADPLVRDFMRYSDSVDERMMGLANRRKDPKEINFSSWERRRDFHELSSDSDEELPTASTSQKYSTPREWKEGIGSETKSDGSFSKNNVFGKQYQQQNEELLGHEGTRPSKAQELVKKFNAIEHLREKESSKQPHEDERPKSSFDAQRAQEEDDVSEQKTNLEEFFGHKKLGKRHRNMWKGKESTSDEPDGTFSNEESDKEIDELVELLSSTSLIKIYDENLALPNEEEEILKTFLQPEEKQNSSEGSIKIQRKKTVESLFNVFENVPETESKENIKVQLLDDETDWKDNELCITFDGYDIDNPSSFHDWMLDEILSKSLNTTSEPELTVCSKCFAFHNDTHECFQE